YSTSRRSRSRRPLTRNGSPAASHVMVVLLHCDAAGEPFRVRGRRERDRRLVEYLRAVQLVERVAADDLPHCLLVFGRLVMEIVGSLYLGVPGHVLLLTRWARRRMPPDR